MPTPCWPTLQSQPGELRDTEIKPFLDQLVSVGNFDLAYLAWLEFFPSDQPAGANLIYNGDFDSPPTNIAFDWVLGDVPGAATEVASLTTPIEVRHYGSVLRTPVSPTVTPASCCCSDPVNTPCQGW